MLMGRVEKEGLIPPHGKNSGVYRRYPLLFLEGMLSLQPFIKLPLNLTVESKNIRRRRL